MAFTDREKLSLINAHSPWYVHPGYGAFLNTKRIQWLLNEFTNFEFGAPPSTLFTIEIKVADIFPAALIADARPLARTADIFPTATVQVEEAS